MTRLCHLVRAWQHHQAAVHLVNVLHGGPAGHDFVGGPEGKVVKVLVQGVARRLV